METGRVNVGRVISRWLLVVCAGLLNPGCGQRSEGDFGSATEHFLAAQDAISKGDSETALSELSKSIELQPDVWAYYERAKLYVEMKQIDLAKADCSAGLLVDPEHAELQWLQEELNKPAERRFQGRNANPPAPRK